LSNLNGIRNSFRSSAWMAHKFHKTIGQPRRFIQKRGAIWLRARTRCG